MIIKLNDCELKEAIKSYITGKFYCSVDINLDGAKIINADTKTEIDFFDYVSIEGIEIDTSSLL